MVVDLGWVQQLSWQMLASAPTFPAAPSCVGSSGGGFPLREGGREGEEKRLVGGGARSERAVLFISDE